MSYSYFDTLDKDHQELYNSKLRAASLECCPFKIHEDTWKNDPMLWPSIEYGDIYTYLIDFPRLFSREKMKNYKSLEAHAYFKDGWVETIYHISKRNSIILKCKVKPSQRVTEEPHQPWVALTKDGTVITGHCTCMAGLGETCSHVAAMLFKMEAAVRLGYTSTSCTSEACKWNSTFLKNVCAAPISKIEFYKDSYGEKSAAKKRKLIAAPTQAEIDQFLIDLKKVSPKSVLLSAYETHHHDFVDKNPDVQQEDFPIDLRSEYNDNNLLSLQENCELVMKKLYDITEVQRLNVSKVTIGQSASAQWFKYRAGRITSSTAHSLFVTSLNSPSITAILKITTLGTQQNLGPTVEHGNKYEQSAINSAVSEMKKTHQNVNLSKVGLLISSEIPYISASPDFIISCECCGQWVGEVKCPYIHRESVVSDIKDPTFSLDNNTLKTSHPHYTQVQMHMYCSGIDKCLYVVWTFKGVKIVTVHKDKDFLTTLISNLRQKYEQIILPEIVTRKFEFTKQLEKTKKADKENTTKTFCICNGPETGDMIGCDNPNCNTGNQWFHFTCLKIKRAPKGRWLCRNCRKSCK